MRTWAARGRTLAVIVPMGRATEQDRAHGARYAAPVFGVFSLCA
jgi:hypothetical protein